MEKNYANLLDYRWTERRFPCSLKNLLNNFSHKVNRCICFMNDGEAPVLVFEQTGDNRDIIHADYYELLQKAAQ